MLSRLEYVSCTNTVLLCFRILLLSVPVDVWGVEGHGRSGPGQSPPSAQEKQGLLRQETQVAALAMYVIIVDLFN